MSNALFMYPYYTKLWGTLEVTSSKAWERTDWNQSVEQICLNSKGFCTVPGVILRFQPVVDVVEEDVGKDSEFPLKSLEYFSF